MHPRPHRILIVDDDLDTLANLSDILADVGYETETASNSQVAIEKIANVCPNHECRFDLCLLDFKLPGMDGVELLKKLQSQDPELQTIMITAYAGDDGIERALAAGSQRVLRKPVDVRKLLNMINEAVANN